MAARGERPRRWPGPVPVPHTAVVTSRRRLGTGPAPAAPSVPRPRVPLAAERVTAPPLPPTPVGDGTAAPARRPLGAGATDPDREPGQHGAPAARHGVSTGRGPLLGPTR
ncbi:hypothetical protein GCM10027168_27050 [Streptomyces capparidis]